MQTIKERRKAPRNPSGLDLDIYDAKGHAVVGEGKCIDLSILGARVLSEKPLKNKSSIRLQIVPADKPILDLAAKVIWVRKRAPGYEYGVCFNPKSVGPLS